MNKKSGMTRVEMLVLFVIFISTAFLFFWLGIRKGSTDSIRKMRVEAVDLGVAEWAVKDSEGSVVFRWVWVDEPSAQVPTWVHKNISLESVYEEGVVMWTNGTFEVRVNLVPSGDDIMTVVRLSPIGEDPVVVVTAGEDGVKVIKGEK